MRSLYILLLISKIDLARVKITALFRSRPTRKLRISVTCFFFVFLREVECNNAYLLLLLLPTSNMMGNKHEITALS